MLTKGAHVQVEGEIRTRQYTPNTADANTIESKSITEIRAISIVKLDRPKNTEDAA
jgi:single-stranded DNA-binding protein